jgi:hypothetical protein
MRDDDDDIQEYISYREAFPKDYRLPKPWVGLTDEEIEKLITDAGFSRSDLLMMGACIDQIARLVEARLKELNT